METKSKIRHSFTPDGIKAPLVVGREKVSLRDRTDTFINGLAVIVSLARMPSEIQGLMKDQLEDFLGRASGEGEWVKLAKYICQLPLSQYLKQTSLPEAPGGEQLVWRGRLGRWMRTRIAWRSTRNQALWSSWLQAKRGCLPASDGQILETYEKHESTLKAPDRGVATTIARVMADGTFQRVLEEVSLSVARQLRAGMGGFVMGTTESFPGRVDFVLKEPELDFNPEECLVRPRPNFFPADSSDEDEVEDTFGYLGPRPGEGVYAWPVPCFPEPTVRSLLLEEQTNSLLAEIMRHEAEWGPEGLVRDRRRYQPWIESKPSRSACFEGSRSTGGCARELWELSLNWDVRQFASGKVDASRKGWLKSREICDFGWATRNSSTLLYEMGERRGGAVWEKQCRTDPEDYALEMSNIIEDYLREGMEKPANCTVHGIVEPLKIRTITKDEARCTYAAKPLQVALRKALLAFSCFKLLGRPMCPTDFVRLNELSEPEEGEMWQSVDYTAATDGLSWKYSGQVLEKVIEKLDAPLRDAARRNLGPHQLWYPEWCYAHQKFERPMPRGMQTTGQLMGSVISFPILCLCNLGLYLTVTSDRQDSYCDADRLDKVLINGDDIAYPGTPEERALHEAYGLEVGLELNQAKSYAHDEYVNINSQCVLLKLGSRGTPRFVPSFNVGLFMGQTKVMGDTDDQIEFQIEEFKTPLCSNLQKVINCAPWDYQSMILSKYLSLHKDLLKLETRCRAYMPDGSVHRFNRNLFISECLGGMGLRPPPGYVVFVTKLQKQLAWNLLNTRITGPAMGPQKLGFCRGRASDPTPVLAMDNEPVARTIPFYRDSVKYWVRFDFSPLDLDLVEIHPVGITPECLDDAEDDARRAAALALGYGYGWFDLPL